MIRLRRVGTRTENERARPGAGPLWVVLALKYACDFNLKDELTNVILIVFRSFVFLHSQGQKQTSALGSNGSGIDRGRADMALTGRERLQMTHHVIYGATGIGAVLRPPITIATNFGCPAIET